MSDTPKRLRMAARALSRAGLVHAYGHASIRTDDGQLLVTPGVPLGLVSTDEPGVVVPVDGNLPPGVAGEVVVHQAIYRARSDVGAICRIQSPKLMTVSCTGAVPQRRHGFGAYLDLGYWDDPRLVRSPAAAQALTSRLGAGNAIVMRGNGAFVVAPTIERAVVLSWYLEDVARVVTELFALAGSNLPVLTELEVAERATWAGGIEERMWLHLTADDPEGRHV